MRWGKEIALLMTIFVITAMGVHPDLLSTPQNRFYSLIARENYFHPLFYTAIIYLLLGVLRLIVNTIKKFFVKQLYSDAENH
jgi:ABC-type uncharacterized transport system fused permease/ATPase subunit